MSSILLICGLLAAFDGAMASEPPESRPAVMLAQNYAPGIDPSHYLISEKLDGVRAIWDGKMLRFRSGRIINAPGWFTVRFPAHPLDGELWFGRHQFDRISAIVRKSDPVDDDWKTLTYQVFDLPNGAGSFEARLTELKLSIEQAQVPWLQLVSQFDVVDEKSLQRLLHQYVGGGSEGLMLHRRDALWQTGRTDALLKLKMILDAEATVIGYEPGKGKYKGMTGALVVQMPNGKTFRLGTGLSDAVRRTPPEIGAVITYQYRDLTPQGIPKFASFYRVRRDE